MVLCITGEAGQSALEKDSAENAVGGIQRKSTRAWANETSYNPHKLFNKVVLSINSKRRCGRNVHDKHTSSRVQKLILTLSMTNNPTDISQYKRTLIL